MEADRAASVETTQTIHNEYSDVSTGIGCFDGTFKLRVKEGSHSYQTLPRRVKYMLQQPPNEELETADNCTFGCRHQNGTMASVWC